MPVKNSRAAKNVTNNGPVAESIYDQPTPSTPLAASATTPSSSHSNFTFSKSFVPYQCRGSIRIPSPQVEKGSMRTALGPTHRTMRIGLGTPSNNLKATHIINSKKSQNEKLVSKLMRNITPSYKQQGFSSKAAGDVLTNSVTSRMQKLTLYESPKCRKDTKDKKKLDNNNGSVFDVALRSLDKKVNALAIGRKVTFTLGSGTQFTAYNPVKTKNPQSSNNDEEAQAIPNLCRHFRSLLGWKMSLYIKWKFIQDRVKLWPYLVPLLSVEEISDLLKISSVQLCQFLITPELNEIFEVLRRNLSHVTFPNIAKALALSELQQENVGTAARYLSECNGMYLQSEIVDKHLNYVRRNEELHPNTPLSDSEKFKTEVFLSQVQYTLEFSNSCFEKNGEKEFQKLSSFDKDWNVIQISTSIISTNRFGNDLIGKRQVPQLILSAFCFVPTQNTTDRYQFTTCCPEPKIEPGSLMRYGLLEEFQKLLDKNLSISDEATIISRKKYWEERSKHNSVIEGIMDAMEDWIYPWSFLLPGTVKDISVRYMIITEIMSDDSLKKSTDSQKLLIYRLTENYNLLPVMARNVLDSLVAFILQIDENVAEILARKISDVGASICLDAPRNPTILVLDQEIDILPWDCLPCFRLTHTDVSRMPSLNLIYSTKNVFQSVMKELPRIVEPEKCTFILNPDGTLPQVQKRLEKYFLDRKEWTPIIARSPTAQEMQEALENQHLLLYCGHGAGSSFYPEYAVQKLVCKAVPLLMGCSSAQSHFNGPRLYANSSIHAYFIAGCPSVVGFLWEVTDTECDRITVDFLERWVPDPKIKPPKMPFFDCVSTRNRDENLPTALRKSRQAATQLVTQCAVVCYGLPIVAV